MEELEERREAALAASPALDPNFHSSRVSQDQIKKLLELQKRRLQIKEKSKIQKSSKGSASGASKTCERELSIKDCQDECGTILVPEDSIISGGKPNTYLMGMMSKKDEAAQSFRITKRKKLHWGLDTKERWERKANM